MGIGFPPPGGHPGLIIPPDLKTEGRHQGGGVFTFDTVRYGDCQQESGKLILNSDPNQFSAWSCIVFTYTTHSGDQWRSGFELYDANGVPLGSSYFNLGPRMNDGNPPPRYDWNDTVKFNASYDINRVARVLQSSRC